MGGKAAHWQHHPESPGEGGETSDSLAVNFPRYGEGSLKTGNWKLKTRKTTSLKPDSLTDGLLGDPRPQPHGAHCASPTVGPLSPIVAHSCPLLEPPHKRVPKPTVAHTPPGGGGGGVVTRQPQSDTDH